jgi:hypothetical protein
MYEDSSEEVRQHLQEKTEDLIAGGMCPEESIPKSLCVSV